MKKIFLILSLFLAFLSVSAQRPVDSADLRTKINQWVITNGSKQITAVQINNLFNGVADLMTQYSFDSAYRINDTLFLAGPKLPTFKITMKAGTLTAVSGTENRITSSGGASPAIDISATFEALLGKVANRIDQNNAATTSAQLASVISDETGTGPLVFSASPTFTGTPLVPTAAPGTNTTQIASTAFVAAAVAAGGGGGGSSFTRQSITSGSSGTVTGGKYIVTFNPASVLASYTLTLPASPSDMDEVEIEAGGTITGAAPVVTALTISPNSGQTIHQTSTPTTINDGETIKYRYRTANTAWYRKQ